MATMKYDSWYLKRIYNAQWKSNVDPEVGLKVLVEL